VTWLVNSTTQLRVYSSETCVYMHECLSLRIAEQTKCSILRILALLTYSLTLVYLEEAELEDINWTALGLAAN